MNHSRWFCFLLILVTVLIGGLLRWFVAQHDGLWLDELHTAWVTNDGWSVVAPRAMAGNQSGLYFWLVRGVRSGLGDSVLALRAVSLVAGLLLIFLATHLTWKWTRSGVATFVVGWLIAIDPQFVFYGTEARPYGLVELLSVIQVLLFWAWLARLHSVGDPEPSWIKKNSVVIGLAGSGLGLTTSLLMSVHVTAAWLPMTEALFVGGYLVLAQFKRGWQVQIFWGWLSAIGIACLTAGLCFPVWQDLNYVFARRSNWSTVASIPQLLNDFRWPVLLSIVLPTILATIFYAPNQEAIDAKLFGLKNTQRTVMRIPFVLLWALAPVLGVFLVDRLHIAPLAMTRYTLVGAVAIPIFCGLCVGLPGKVQNQLAIAAILVGVSLYHNPFATSLWQFQPLPHLRVEDWSSPIAEINARADKSDDPVFVFGNVIEDVHAFATEDTEFLEYLQFPIRGLDVVDLQHRVAVAAPTMSPQHFRPTDIQLMKQQGGGWLIIRGDTGLVAEISDDFRALEARMMALEIEEQQRVAAEKKNQAENDKDSKAESAAPMPEVVPPQIQFAQFPQSNVHLIAIDWPRQNSPVKSE